MASSNRQPGTSASSEPGKPRGVVQPTGGQITVCAGQHVPGMKSGQGKAASLFCIIRLLCYHTAYAYLFSTKEKIMQNNPPSGPNEPSYTPQPYPPPGQPYYPPGAPLPMGPQPKKRRTWLWIVLGVFALAVLGCVGILAASQGATSAQPQATQASGNTPATGNTPAPT